MNRLGLTHQVSTAFAMAAIHLHHSRHIESLGYALSVHRIPSSLLGTVGAFLNAPPCS